MPAFLLIILFIISVYFFIIFIVSPFVIPHLRKIKVPAEINSEMQKTIDEISEKTKDSDEKFIKAILDLLKDRYIIKIWQTHLYPQIMFRKDINKIWHQVGEKQSCNVLNFVMKTILVKSGRFNEENIKERLTFYEFNIHQYLEIKTSNQIVFADPWGYLAGKVDFGEYATGFEKRGSPVN
ncbi:MAG: hypothetical protein QMD50_02495 [Patescibacteria group bacterium]|nr:hypothetical protein [Patescibacteria group bacterium]